ncbi:helix-turn-helix domain-containing protein [Nocardioides sp.]|uniref:helix-turn-helix domain-containing protein n=1 Tax=Nocardioides sp. TaxID=35761 RepID=UPI002C3E64D9|nr:helix-turn-helix domain-containing protein [Nocardioides sp.]HXH77300.1 helix-turn-helix domain-containing protein [Nocardioides sp.]
MTVPSPDQLHTADQAAEVLDVPAATIRKWARAGKAMPAGILPAAVPGGSQALYTLAELRPLADSYHERRSRRTGSASD